MFAESNNNVVNRNSVEHPYVQEIRDAGYYLPDEVAQKTSPSEFFSVAMTIKCKNLFLEHNPVSFDLPVGNEKFIVTETDTQKRIAYSLYFAQKFVDMAFNEEMGAFVYQNKEEIIYDESFMRFFKTFIRGIFTIRELEHLTHVYHARKNQDKTINTFPKIGQGADEVKFISEIRSPKRSYNTLTASYRGLTFSLVFGQTMIVENNKMIIRRDYVHHRQLRTTQSPVFTIPDITEKNWNNFLSGISDTYVPMRTV